MTVQFCIRTISTVLSSILHICKLVAMISRPVWTRLTFPLSRSYYSQFEAQSYARFACSLQRPYSSSPAQKLPSRRSWSTGRVLLISAFASSLTYIFGVLPARSQSHRVGTRDDVPKYLYGSASDLAQAGLYQKTQLVKPLMHLNIGNRRIASAALRRCYQY